MMKFRKYSPNDHDLVSTFMKLCYSCEAPTYFLNQETSVLAFDSNEELIGMGLQYRSELHDRTICIEICVHPKNRRKGLGTELYNKLMQEFPVKENDYALDIKSESKDVFAFEFAKSLGFECYLKCYNHTYNIDELKVVNSDLKLISLSEFYKDEVNKEAVRNFHCAAYDRDHEPYLPLTKDEEVRYGFYYEGDIEYGVVALDGDKIVGCSLAFLNFEEEIETDLTDICGLHGYGVASSTEAEAHIVQALYGHQIQKLKEAGKSYIYIEFDSIETTSDLMVDWLPYVKKPLLRFQKLV